MDGIQDNALTDFLLRKVTIYHGNKVLREGKLLLFSIKDFHLHFTLDINSITKNFEMPYPFKSARVNNVVLLDFTLSAFKAEFNDLERRIKNIGNKKKSRYYNSILRLHTA